MTDDRFDQTPADEELLSAYLAGELPTDEVEAFEQRLGREPELAARLDGLAGALVALGGFDAAVPPEGFDERLEARLEAERSVPDLAAQRARRDRSRVWLGIGTAAAVLAAGAVMAGPILSGLGSGGSDMAGESAQVESAADGDAAPQAPVLLDERVVIADEEGLRRRYETLPEADGLLGTPLTEADELAERFSAAMDGVELTAKDEAPAATSDSALSGGTGGGSGAGAGGDDSQESAASSSESAPQEEAPVATAPDAVRARRQLSADTCLATVTEGATEPLVPVRIETLRYAGQRALAYVFVTASPDAGALDRTEVWVVRVRDCATLVFQQY